MVVIMVIMVVMVVTVIMVILVIKAVIVSLVTKFIIVVQINNKISKIKMNELLKSIENYGRQQTGGQKLEVENATRESYHSVNVLLAYKNETRMTIESQIEGI
jgi:biopolymer transport protein ExbB/TolQ